MKTKEYSSKRLAVIVNCHNSERYLAETLESLISQSYPHITVFVVDNQSTDGTHEIVEKYMPCGMIELIETDSFVPLSTARNFALKQIMKNNKYDYFSFCDSDDYVHLQWAERLMSIAEIGDFDLVHCNGYIFSDEECSDADNFILGNLYKYRNPIYLNSCIIKSGFFCKKLDKP